MEKVLEHYTRLNDLTFCWQDADGYYHQKCVCGAEWSAWTSNECAVKFIEHLNEVAR